VRLDRDLRQVFRRSINLRGSFSFCRRHGAGDLSDAVELLTARPVWAQLLVTTRYPMSALPSALERLATGRPRRPIKAVLVKEPENPT
jgi:threonine dehydrogenase-like Zn-dependent dehydrogenase